MPNRINRLMRQEMVDRYRDAEHLIAIGYEGLDVVRTDALRATLADRDLNMRLVKNRIAKLAFEEIGVPGVDRILEGQVAFVRGTDPVRMARTIRDFAREHHEVVFRGAVVERTVLDAEAARGLADAATKEELQGRISGAALGPGGRVGGALLGPAGTLAACIQGLVSMREKAEAS